MLSKLFALFSPTKNIGCKGAIVSFLDTASLRVEMSIIKPKVTIFNHFTMLSNLFELFSSTKTLVVERQWLVFWILQFDSIIDGRNVNYKAQSNNNFQ
jgi:hypothetical protein